MEQHPIPQQISSYQFRLIGDMTLKQFSYVAGGVLLGLLIYATALHPLIKWPLILISVGMGAAFAFLPFEERPLSTWFLSFFRSVYSPTVFIWKKVEKPVQYFKEEQMTIGNLAHGHAKTKEETKYYSTPASTEPIYSKSLDKMESNLLNKITGLFTNIFVPKHKIKESIPFLPPKEEAKEEEKKPEDAFLPEEKADEVRGVDQNVFSGQSGGQTINVAKEADVKPKIKAPQIEIPTVAPVTIATQGFRPKIVVEEKTLPLEDDVPVEPQTTEVAPVLAQAEVQSLSGAQFSIDAAPPHPPTIPNTIVGQVMSHEGKIIEGAILEIRDLAGRPVRALRSNKVGHFMIVTSLPNGQYELRIEKESYIFEPLSFTAEGELIPPIAIRAQQIVDSAQLQSPDQAGAQPNPYEQT